MGGRLVCGGCGRERRVGEPEALYHQGPAEEPGVGGCSYVCGPVRGRDRVVVYLCFFAGWEARIRGSEEWIWGRRGAGLGFTWVCFLFEKRGGLFFF